MQSIDKKVTVLLEYMSEIFLRDVSLIDLRSVSSVADYFIIATVQSRGQLKGAIRRIHEYFYTNAIDCKGGKKQDFESDWILLDCNDFIIHLMNEESRIFYDLEGLWESLGAKIIHESEE